MVVISLQDFFLGGNNSRQICGGSMDKAERWGGWGGGGGTVVNNGIVSGYWAEILVLLRMVG